MLKKACYLLAGVLFIFIITNPSDSAFNGFLGEREFSEVNEQANYIVCSIYSVEGLTTDSVYMKEEYFAILGKFYKISPRVSKPSRDTLTNLINIK